jgi:hypothetical protein
LFKILSDIVNSPHQSLENFVCIEFNDATLQHTKDNIYDALFDSTEIALAENASIDKYGQQAFRGKGGGSAPYNPRRYA